MITIIHSIISTCINEYTDLMIINFMNDHWMVVDDNDSDSDCQNNSQFSFNSFQFASQVKENGQSTDAKARARGFHDKLMSKKTVYFGHFLWDTLITLARLSVFLQTRTLSVAEVADQLDGQIAVLEKYAEQ